MVVVGEILFLTATTFIPVQFAEGQKRAGDCGFKLEANISQLHPSSNALNSGQSHRLLFDTNKAQLKAMQSFVCLREPLRATFGIY